MSLDDAIDAIVASLRSGGTLYACGNGGSHAQADHLVAELVGRFAYDRRPLRAVLLSTNGAVGSCLANDYGYGEVFARQLEALARPGDVLVAFTTSGRSANVRRALETASSAVVLTGPEGLPDTRLHSAIVVRSAAQSTPAIQEDHQRWVHEIARRVEGALCPR